MALGPGSRLDAYEIVRLLGAGGMGEVWLATEVRLGRKVALKVLPADLTRRPLRVQRFEQEARAASALNHPSVCHIYAVGETADDQHYIAMEYVEGETLRQRLWTTRLSLREALEISIQVAAALSAAHGAGITHRDIKPENVMLRPDGFVKVLDFGLAKLIGAAPEMARGDTTQTVLKTAAGVVVGTAAYMSPEQARGQEVDARTDIWSLGVLLYEMVAGRSPFTASSGSEVLAAILDRDPAPLARFEPDTPTELQRITTKALQKDRNRRYHSIEDLRLDLQALREDLAAAVRSGAAQAGHEATQPRTLDTSSGAKVSAARRRRLVLGAAAAILVVGATVGAWYWRTARGVPARTSQSVPVQRNLTRLTYGPGLQTEPTLSPDGRFIAYAADRNGNFDIWVQPVTGGNAVQITRSVAHDTQPDWSPDGSTLVFRSERLGGGLFVVPALGGVEHQLTSFGSYPFWTPDSSEILFMDEARIGNSQAPARLFVVSPEEGTPREILAEFFRGGSWSWIGGHPDGRISAMGKHRQFGWGFFTVARDGTRGVQSKQVPDFPLRIYESGPFARRRFRWHPSGTSLYLQTLSNGVYNLWRVRVDPNTLLWVSAERLTTGAGPDVAPVVSRDGARLAFTTEQGSARVWVFPLDPVTRRLGSGRPLTEEGARVAACALSPDGRRVAYDLSRPGIGRSEMWITNIEDGTSDLVPTAAGAGDPCWSPDGKAIAYVYSRWDKWPVTGRTAVRQLGGKEHFISRWSTHVFMDFDWSPHRGLVGSYLDTQTEVASLVVWPSTNPDADKPDQVLVSSPKTGFWQAQVSPNGRWVSFVAIREARPGVLEMGVAPADGSRAEHWIRIAADHTWPDKPRWAPDGRTLYFLSRRPEPVPQSMGNPVRP